MATETQEHDVRPGLRFVSDGVGPRVDVVRGSVGRAVVEVSGEPDAVSGLTLHYDEEANALTLADDGTARSAAAKVAQSSRVTVIAGEVTGAVYGDGTDQHNDFTGAAVISTSTGGVSIGGNLRGSVVTGSGDVFIGGRQILAGGRPVTDAAAGRSQPMEPTRITVRLPEGSDVEVSRSDDTRVDVAGAVHAVLRDKGRLEAASVTALDVEASGDSSVSVTSVTETTRLVLGNTVWAELGAVNGALEAQVSGEAELEVKGVSLTSAAVEVSGSARVSAAGYIRQLSGTATGKSRLVMVGQVDDNAFKIASPLARAKVNGSVMTEAPAAGRTTPGPAGYRFGGSR